MLAEIEGVLHFSGLWGLVNNAAIQGLVGPAEWLTKDNYQVGLKTRVSSGTKLLWQ